MRVRLRFELLLAVILIQGCAASSPSSRTPVLPPETASIWLSGTGESGFPVIGLTSGALTLEFDAFHPDIRYYTIRFRHLNRDGSPSPLLPGVFMRGMPEDLITEATPSTSQIPIYTAYRYRFPNETIGFTKSGRYAADVIDPASGSLLFSLPFFVQEAEGEARFSVREFFNHPSGARISHQPVLEYRYPEGMVMAHVDHQTMFVQNRWFDRTRQAELADMSENGLLVFHLRESDAMAGSFDIRSGSFQAAGTLGPGLAEADAGQAVPTVAREPDVFGLTPVVRSSWTNRSGANRNRDARYGLMTFRFEHDSTQPLTLLGTFNQWDPRTAPRMRNTADGYWEATVLLKEGGFHYAYQATGAAVPLGGLHSGSAQEYTALVYRHDAAERYDRLVQVRTVRTR